MTNLEVNNALDIIHGQDVAEELAALADREPGRVYGTEGGKPLTVAGLHELTGRVSGALARAGVCSGARVAVALPNSTLHAAVIFALNRLGALWVPLDGRLRGTPLRHLLQDSATTHLVAEDGSGIVAEVGEHRQALYGTGLGQGTPLADSQEAPALAWRSDAGGPLPEKVPDAALLMYTSGTTGPPKGVLVSQTMWRAAALGAIEVTDVRPGDVLYVWEPLFHIGGAQTLLLPLYANVCLALTPRFSASRFWQEVTEVGATHIHYLGGILQILLQQPESPLETGHQVRVAWGAGATPALWTACQHRFGFAIHECYGMTETSSIVTVNRDDPEGGVGTPLPWFDVRLDGQDQPGRTGEILVRGKVPGLITAGYLGNAEATEKSREGDWFRTGDHGQWDETGRLHFTGRASDSVRVRGENVSAWQVEDVFARHPDVDRCAVVGVAASVGEQEMMLLLTTTGGKQVQPEELLLWAADQLAPFQIPRYVKVIDEMPLTPSQRIAKHQLPLGLEGAADCAAARSSARATGAR